MIDDLMNFIKFYEEEGKRIRIDETNKDVPVRYKHLILPLLPKKQKLSLMLDPEMDMPLIN